VYWLLRVDSMDNLAASDMVDGHVVPVLRQPFEEKHFS
jgi:hypothetical protein